MIIQPRVKNFICVTAHPDGCRRQVEEQISYVKSRSMKQTGERVLVIGSSTGYGLASRICAAWGTGSPTIGVCFERPASGKRTATPGWYNTAAFEEFAAADGLYAKTIVGDAFSKEIKEKTAQLIREDWGSVDLVVYSLAAPRRTMADGTVYTSVLKTVGEPFTAKNLDLDTKHLNEKTIEPATEEELAATIHVMGGEDWADWMHALRDAGVLSARARTVAYSYIGPKITYPIYCDGTIGRAKENLYETSRSLTKEGFSAYVSVNKALVTQSSSAIPIVPLYIAILYRVMKEHGTHEDTIAQMLRLWRDYLCAPEITTDIPGRIRIDDREMQPEIQKEVEESYQAVTDENLRTLADLEGYQTDFYHLFGFACEGIDYEKDTEADRKIPSVE